MASDITVLHVDDDENLMSMARAYVRQHYHDITLRSVPSGDEALVHLESSDDVDCVVSDYQMPGSNGLELLEAIRDRWPDLPFILFTGRGDEDIAVRAITTGVTDYVQKRVGMSQYAVLVNRIRNVVARHRAETKLKRASQRTEVQFELLVDTVEDYAIFFLDEDGCIRTWNIGAENIKGYRHEEIVGEHFSTFYREEDVVAGVPDRNLREAATEGRTVDEGWRVRKDGSEFWANVRIVALREDGELLGYAKVTRDSTQRHQEQVLLEQKKQLESLIAAISHDLRNLLTIVDGNVQLARETGDFSRFDAAEGALDRANELLAYLGKLAAEGEQIEKPEPVGLREVAEAAWGVVETEADELDIEGSMVLVADRQRLQQLLENLFTNAAEHAGSDVTVEVGPLDRRDGFYVEDDGPGIPRSERTEVFEMGHTGEAGGTGFGLNICKNIVDSHGWTIEITEGREGGARFEVADVEIE